MPDSSEHDKRIKNAVQRADELSDELSETVDELVRLLESKESRNGG